VNFRDDVSVSSGKDSRGVEDHDYRLVVRASCHKMMWLMI
jgi:hypothetical protein